MVLYQRKALKTWLADAGGAPPKKGTVRWPNEAARIHHASRRRGGRAFDALAARGACAAASDAGDRVTLRGVGGAMGGLHGRLPPRLERNGIRRGPQRRHRISL